MHTALSPRSIFALLVAAEETLAVFSVQALINAGIVKLLPVHGVVESDNSGRRTHVQYRVVRSFGLVAGWSAGAVGVIIECGILHESRENKQEADSDEQVHRCDI